MGNLSNTKNNISVAMISNAMNHHQFPFCDAMFKTKGITFYFIATKPISKERLATGFKDLNTSREYIIRPYESDEEYNKAMKIANECDFVIYGSAPYEYIKKRKKNGKWTFLYSERLFKEVRKKEFFNIKTIVACTLRYFLASHKNLRLLCSSAFSSKDFSYFRFKTDQTYKWGYFPPVSSLTFDEIKNKKEQASIVWVGRMIPLKHPELVIGLAKRLKEKNIDFKLNLIGDGPLLADIKNCVNDNNLENNVIFMGTLSAEETRNQMEKSQILISTSDHNEGWGAIINEGMASGCAVVASHMMGSVPYLIDNEKNGYVFESGNLEDLVSKVEYLLKNNEKCLSIGKDGYNTITNQWNGESAAERLSELMKHYIAGETDFAFESGVCSHAEHFDNHWYKAE